MKKLILFFFFSLLTFHFSLAQWVDLGSHFPDTINSACLPGMFCIGDTCWIVSCSQANILYYSTNGCQTITAKSVPDRANAVWFLNYNLGYIATQGGHVYKSTDGGDTWMIHGVAGSALYNMTFPPNSTTGWVCGYHGHLHKVTPTGVSVDYGTFVSSMMSLSFPDTAHGWVCGQSIISPYKNGAWGGMQSYSSGSWSDIFFLNDTLGWAAGDFMGGGYMASGIMRTTDGINWFDQDNPTGEGMFAILFINENEGWAGSSGGKLVHTTDGGNNWVIDAAATAISTGKFIREMFYVPSRQAFYILGNHRLLMKNGSVNGIALKEENDKNSVSIYPNPCKDVLNLQFNQLQKNVQITIVNLFGKEVKRIENGYAQHQVSVIDLPVGIYFIRIESDKQTIIKKFFVER